MSSTHDSWIAIKDEGILSGNFLKVWTFIYEQVYWEKGVIINKEWVSCRRILTFNGTWIIFFLLTHSHQGNYLPNAVPTVKITSMCSLHEISLGALLHYAFPLPDFMGRWVGFCIFLTSQEHSVNTNAIAMNIYIHNSGANGLNR